MSENVPNDSVPSCERLVPRRQPEPSPADPVAGLALESQQKVATLHCEPIYGFYHGQDPRTFSPDAECCSERERAAHKAACEAAQCGEWTRDNSGCHQVSEGLRILKSSFGVGVYHVVMTADLDYVRDATYEDYLREGEWPEALEECDPRAGAAPQATVALAAEHEQPANEAGEPTQDFKE